MSYYYTLENKKTGAPFSDKLYSMEEVSDYLHECFGDFILIMRPLVGFSCFDTWLLEGALKKENLILKLHE
jgi:hypothetical protein